MRYVQSPATPTPAGTGRAEAGHNPWISAAPPTSPEASPVAAATHADVDAVSRLGGPPAPQGAVAAPPCELLLACREHHEGARVWWLGAHGGAGETTLALLLEGSREAAHAWPETTGAPAAVVLVARTSAHGLRCAQAAAAQWAAAATPQVRLLGLVLVADAPGRLPAPLHTWVKVISGGVPRVWQVPWIEPLRLGEDPTSLRLPRCVRRVLADVEALTSQPYPPSPSDLEEVSHAAHAAARR